MTLQDLGSRVINYQSSEDIDSLVIPPDLTKRKTFLRLSCNLEGANVFIGTLKVFLESGHCL